MPKLEDDVKSLKDEIEEIKKVVNQISFNIVRMLGTLEKTGGTSSGGTSSEGSVGSVSVDLGPLEDKIDRIESMMSTKTDLAGLKELIEKIVSEKLKNAESMQERATNLLEKGMELVELEATLVEIKSLLEERILGDESEDKGE